MNLGDGLGFGRSGPVLALWGDNLMKLAPLLGELLASAALDRDREVRDDDVPHLVATE
jgi:hypothetical protein